MYCPYCRSLQSSVIDKRSVKGTGEIRRRRECLKCKRRFTTYERASAIELLVIKRDGRRQPFDSAKLRAGLERCLEKRPAVKQLDEILLKIERKIRSKDRVEIESKVIGREVLGELKKIDQIAYLRYVSVYREFKQASDFTKELESLIKS